MTNVNIGDKVNFLNAVGGGKVTKIIDSRMVMVEIEDGFELPCLISDLVLDYRSQPARQQQIVDTVQKEIQEKQLVQQQQQEEARHGGLRRFAKEAEKEGVYLAFVPHEQQWVLTGSMDVMLVNHTPFEMLYTFTIKEEDKFVNVDYGQLDKYEKVVVETISREDLEYWCNGIVQAIFTAETSDSKFSHDRTKFKFICSLLNDILLEIISIFSEFSNIAKLFAKTFEIQDGICEEIVKFKFQFKVKSHEKSLLQMFVISNQLSSQSK